MEDYFKSVRKATVDSAPYPPRNLSKLAEDKQRWSKLSAPLFVGGKKPSSSTITKHLLNTLSDSSNPITHSNIYGRSDTVVTATTGHQRGEGRALHGTSSKAYFDDRSKKLSLQRRDADEIPKGVLSNVRIHIDGYLSSTTDIELKGLIAHAGGTILTPVHVVKPEWVTDSIAAGRRLPESSYVLLRSSGTRDIVDMFKSGRSG